MRGINETVRIPTVSAKPPYTSASLFALCAYECAALGPTRLPPVSHGMWKLPKWLRFLVFGAAVLIGYDHFFTRRWC